MKVLIRIGLVAALVVAAVAGAVAVLSDPGLGKSRRPVARSTSRPSVAPSTTATAPAPPVPLYSDGYIDDSGFDLATRWMAPIADRSALAEVRAACRERSRRGRAELQEALDQLARAPGDPAARARQTGRLQMFMALLYMHDGHFDAAVPWIEKARGDASGLPEAERANLLALLGVAALRRGELDNCVACLGPTSCILPIAPEARHQFPAGSRAAVEYFTAYLAQRPDDLGVRWLLNVACMTLGEYPDKVPPRFLIPLDRFRSTIEVGRFVNVAPKVGLDTRGPNMLGGSLFDDFNGDDLPDVFVGSGDCDLGASLFINRGDGTFEDRGASMGLAEQAMAVNAQHADFDNDGRLDVVLLRGGWETPYRLSLLRNRGDRFEDVTVAAGLAEPIATQSAAWGDYDNDGRLDLFVAGEYHDPDPRNRCRLYHNNGDGTFTNLAAQAGVENERWAKGAAWGDYDDDGRLDLYVSNMNGDERLYHNNGDGTFTDRAPELGVTGPSGSFSCWFWDYDNDGRLDILVTGFRAWLQDVAADYLGEPSRGERPRLYRNLGADGFRDVTAEAGLDRVWMPMGSNFADFDNDGDLDIYLATGRPAYSNLFPNVLLKNVGGRRFEDVTLASGTGHLQKGHGVSFADYDGDGDLDLFVELGGQTPGDRAHNVLFQNPGGPNRWLKLKLTGTASNRSALGARIRADLKRHDGTTRALHRVVTSGSSFGGNTLVVTLGLGDAEAVETLTITWPTSTTRQTFHDLKAGRFLEIREGSDTPRAVEWRERR